MHNAAFMVTATEIKDVRTKIAEESQEAFGARFGVDQSTIHRWETSGPPSRGPGRKALERVLSELREAARC